MAIAGDILLKYRLKHELSETDVAFMLDIPLLDYIAIENDKAELGLKHMLKLCQYYKIKPEEFLKNDEIKEVTVEAPHVHEPAAPTQAAEEDDDDDFEYPFLHDLDKSKRTVKPKDAVKILKAHGSEITEEEAEKVLDFMYKIAPLALAPALREAKWEQKLIQFPNGFKLTKKGLSCRICRRLNDSAEMWYDRFGLKCMVCQEAVRQQIIPGEVTGNNDLFYSEFDLDYHFNLKGPVLKEWIKKGLLKPRTIPKADGKGKHFQLFLISDHEKFLPPKEMLRVGSLVTEEINGKEYYKTLKWFEYYDPFDYLKDYDIMKYMKPKEQ